MRGLESIIWLRVLPQTTQSSPNNFMAHVGGTNPDAKLSVPEIMASLGGKTAGAGVTGLPACRLGV